MKTFDLGHVHWLDAGNSVDIDTVNKHCTDRFRRIVVDDRKFKLNKGGVFCKGGLIYKEGNPPAFVEFWKNIEVGETFLITYRGMFSDISGHEIKCWLKRELSIGRRLAVKIVQKDVWTLSVTKLNEVTL